MGTPPAKQAVNEDNKPQPTISGETVLLDSITGRWPGLQSRRLLPDADRLRFLTRKFDSENL